MEKKDFFPPKKIFRWERKKETFYHYWNYGQLNPHKRVSIEAPGAFS